jgi:hypothetical protein
MTPMPHQRFARFTRVALTTASILLLLTFVAGDLLAAPSGPASALTAEEQQRLATARAAIAKLPEIIAATAKFNSARKAYQEDRQKFPAERDREVAIAFRKATAEFEAVREAALVATDRSLKPLLEREAAAKKDPRRGMNEGEVLSDSDHPGNPAIRPIQDVAGLPRVLLIGDSISIGYTLQVRKLLEGRANVHDAKHKSATEFRASREQYADNLRKLIALMKPTGAKLIFATTTPIPKGGKLSPSRIFDDIEARNEIARKVMSENGVSVDDLYGTILPQIAEVGRPNDVHFKPEGYDVLAKAVASSIEAQLPGK